MSERNTVQQRIISDQLKSMHCHPTIDEVYRAVHEDRPTISKATVYRILNKMADSGKATKVRINNGADHFDHKTHPHYHVVCTKCGRVDDVEIPAPFADVPMPEAADASGYEVTGYDLQFAGLCPDCQQEL